MDANPGKHSSEMDLEELKAYLHYGNTFADAAMGLPKKTDFLAPTPLSLTF